MNKFRIYHSTGRRSASVFLRVCVFFFLVYFGTTTRNHAVDAGHASHMHTIVLYSTHPPVGWGYGTLVKQAMPAGKGGRGCTSFPSIKARPSLRGTWQGHVVSYATVPIAPVDIGQG